MASPRHLAAINGSIMKYSSAFPIYLATKNMDNNEDWISITEPDRRNKLSQQAWEATKSFINNIDWQAFDSLHKYQIEVLESHKRIYKSMGVSYDYGRQEAVAERRSQKEGIIKLMNDIKELAITHFNVPQNINTL